MKKQTLLWIGIVIVLCAAPLIAQEDGGQAGGFLRYGVGGRALGMGRAFTAVADDASGVYWNPAGILGATRLEVSSMYANLFYDSQYAHFGLVIPRPFADTENPFLRFLLGPSSSVGFGWVGLSMAGFEQRNEFSEYLGDFGLQENAFMFSWAKEFLPSWGVFRTGVTLKLAGQHFSGLENASHLSSSSAPERNSAGADFGFTFQPIHAPVFRLISLKYLLPFRFGFSARNVIQPKWSSHDADRFARSLRIGFSYRWILRDWIPETWGSFWSFFEDCEVLTSFDKHYLPDQKDGVYAGMEMVVPVTGTGITVYPRAGINNQTEKRSLGLGLELPFSSSTVLRIDYAYGDHPYLSGDNRFFLTFKAGGNRGSDYFYNKAVSKDIERKDKIRALYSVLADYPNENIPSTVKFLIQEDTSRTSRYLELAGGLIWAEALFRDAKAGIHKDRWRYAAGKAASAAAEYSTVYLDPDERMNDEHLLHYTEALIIAGRPDSAYAVLNRVSESSWEALHLKGVCKIALRDINSAETYFKKAVQFFDDSTETDLTKKEHIVSKRALSAMETAVTLIHQTDYEPAIGFLRIAQKNLDRELTSDYLHYPPYYDKLLNDDAQFLIGLALIMKGDYKNGIAELQKTNLFYFTRKYGIRAANYTDTFIELYKTGNFKAIREEADRILAQFFRERDWPGF